MLLWLHTEDCNDKSAAADRAAFAFKRNFTDLSFGRTSDNRPAAKKSNHFQTLSASASFLVWRFEHLQ